MLTCARCCDVIGFVVLGFSEAAGTDIDAVAVTVGPGLKLCLKVGFVTAVVLAHRLQVPFVAINHLEARPRPAHVCSMDVVLTHS